MLHNETVRGSRRRESTVSVPYQCTPNTAHPGHTATPIAGAPSATKCMCALTGLCLCCVHQSTLHTRTNMLPSTDRTWTKSVTNAAAHDRMKCLTLEWLRMFKHGSMSNPWHSVTQGSARGTGVPRAMRPMRCVPCNASHAMHRRYRCSPWQPKSSQLCLITRWAHL